MSLNGSCLYIFWEATVQTFNKMDVNLMMIFEFDVSDDMKPNIVSRLAQQCAFLYEDALKQMQVESVRALWAKVLIHSNSCLSTYYG